jgi:prepilin-type N-terminal cleavage/methylation domain-containing protein
MIMPHHTEKGFTLVETLVAITILLIVITGPLTISTSAARSTSFSSEQVVAFFLAQEGAEIVQKARDDVVIRKFLPIANANYVADPWSQVMDDTSGPYADCFTTNGCGLELNTDTTGSLETPIECIGTSCQLYYEDTAGVRSRYTHETTGNEATIYSRKITLTAVSTDDVMVESVVTWRTGGQRQDQEVRVETYLYDVYGI